MDFVMNSLLILHKWKVTSENQAQLLQLLARPPQQVGGAAACRFSEFSALARQDIMDFHLGVWFSPDPTPRPQAGTTEFSGAVFACGKGLDFSADPHPVCFMLSLGNDPQALDEVCILPTCLALYFSLPRLPALDASMQLQPSFSLVDLESLSGSWSLNLEEWRSF